MAKPSSNIAVISIIEKATGKEVFHAEKRANRREAMKWEDSLGIFEKYGYGLYPEDPYEVHLCTQATFESRVKKHIKQ